MIAIIDRSLAAASDDDRPIVWRELDVRVDSALRAAPIECSVSLAAVGSKLDANSADTTMLRRYLMRAAGPQQGDALTDALLDWRDNDSTARSLGAEADWYLANGRPSPRNRQFASSDEILLVRGFEARPDLVEDLIVVPARVCLTTAPASVLIALPGFTDDAVRQLMDDRAARRYFSDLPTFVAQLPQAAAESLGVHYSELSVATTVEPPQWQVTVRAISGYPAVIASSVVWLGQFGSHSIVTQRENQ
ncbi:MAG: hypothetical protein ABIX19_04610 [Gemmatimonadaceae bacterium]